MLTEEYERRKEMLRILFKEGKIKPMKFKQLAGFVGVPKEERGQLNEILDGLINEGLITLDVNGYYGLSKARTIEGTFSSTGRNFGFVIPTEENIDDIFVLEQYTLNAMQGDKVIVQLTSEGFTSGNKKKRPEGKIIKIVEHGINKVVGIVKKNKNFCFVIPDNQKVNFDVYVSNENSMDALSGMKVVCEIINYGSDDKNPEGKITEIIGHVNDPGVDILSIVKDMDIPYEFPEEVMNQVNTAIPSALKPEDYEGRYDIREIVTVTIDGEDAKDLDDAITLFKKDNLYHLGVHIADVSHYVTEGSPLDTEAINRGTSCYLADRVIPMLPHKLSNGICSLNHDEDRLALSCFMTIDETGKIIDHSIKETVVNVNERMSYTDVYAIISRSNEETLEKYKDYVDFFDLMLELSKIIRKRREERGSIDFDLPESQLIIDEKGKVVDIKPHERNDATKIIEDFMLAANETIAEEFYWMELPFVYRTHEDPDIEKIESLREFVKSFGYNLHVGEQIYGTDLQKLLKQTEGKEEEALIRKLTLRSMKQARYSSECLGHFGLAAKYYCHFTSPIRRYPDLQIHRIIKEYLHGTLQDRIGHYEKILPEIAAGCSKTERRSVDAERETEKMKKAEYMRGFIGQVFEGVVSGITNWGIYVELPNTCEGMVRFADIEDDFFEVDENCYKAYSKRSSKVYKLGQKVAVMVVGADKLTRTIDFIFQKNA